VVVPAEAIVGKARTRSAAVQEVDNLELLLRQPLAAAEADTAAPVALARTAEFQEARGAACTAATWQHCFKAVAAEGPHLSRSDSVVVARSNSSLLAP
jgi:hypothetical protein